MLDDTILYILIISIAHDTPFYDNTIIGMFLFYRFYARISFQSV